MSEKPPLMPHQKAAMDMLSAELGRPLLTEVFGMAVIVDPRMPKDAIEVVSIKQAWEAAGGKGVPSSAGELLTALRLMNEAEDEVEETTLTLKEICAALGCDHKGRSKADVLAALTNLAKRHALATQQVRTLDKELVKNSRTEP